MIIATVAHGTSSVLHSVSRLEDAMQKENRTVLMSLPAALLQSFLYLILSEMLTAGFAGAAGQILT